MQESNQSAVSWERWVPILSWITGWVNCSGWVALVATGGLLGSQLILGVISLMNPVRSGPAPSDEHKTDSLFFFSSLSHRSTTLNAGTSS